MNRSRGIRLRAVPRIAVAILGIPGAWFLVSTSSAMPAAVGSVASLGPALLPTGLGLVAIARDRSPVHGDIEPGPIRSYLPVAIPAPV